MFDKTFENLLKGLDPKIDPKYLNSSNKKFDLKTKVVHYQNAEKEFFQLASEVDAKMREKVVQLQLTRSSIQPILTDVFGRQPKRQVDKSTLHNEARIGFVDLFGKMNTYWEQSESKKNATFLFDIVPEGEKENQNSSTVPPSAEDQSRVTEARKSSHIRITSKDISSQRYVTEDAISPSYDPSKSPIPKSFGIAVAKSHTNPKQSETTKGKLTVGPDFSLEGKAALTPNKEDSLDNSAHFNFFKPPASLTQITASRESLDKEEQDKNESLKETEKLKQEEAKKLEIEEERKKQEQRELKEQEEKKKNEEMTKQKVEGWIEKIPNYNFLFSDQVLEPQAED